MSWDELSTIENLKDDIPALRDADITDADLQQNIDDAKIEIYDDLSNFVDWDEIEALTVVPRTLSRLSRYKAAELTIIRGWSHDNTVIAPGELGENLLKYFRDMYNGLIDKIAAGGIRILDANNDELEYDAWRKMGPGRVI